MYRCAHCRDLHLDSDQARICSQSDDVWFEEALAEVARILERGPISLEAKRSMTEETEWSLSEQRLLSALREAIPPDSIRSQWWIPGCAHRVDLLVAPIGLVIEVDGSSHEGRVGSDRLRSSVIRSHGYEILRVTSGDADRRPEHIAQHVAARMLDEVGYAKPLAVSA